MKIFLWTLCTIFALTSHSSDSNIFPIANDCSYYLTILCNLDPAPQCCREFDSLTCQEKSDGFLRCRKKAKLRDFCKEDADCDDILHAKCSEGFCICRPNNIQYDEMHCAPLLGGFCWENEKCATENAVCINSECRCKSKYIRMSNNRCVLITIGKYCRDNDDCKNIRNSRCSRNKNCVCIPNYAELNPFMCAPLLNEFCAQEDICFVNNSVCLNNYCRCKDGFFSKLNSNCENALFSKMYCEDDAKCSEVKYSKCNLTNNNCACKENYIAISNSRCASIRLNEDCEDNDCAISHSWCIDNKCQCANGFEWYNSGCIAQLGRLCRDGDDCETIKNSVCSPDHQMCVCERKHFALGKFSCGSVIGGFCHVNEDCLFGLSHCVDNECQCRPDYVAASETQCSLKSSLFSCEQDIECGDPWHNYCSKDNFCICSSNNFALSNATCLPHLNAKCWTDHQCIVSNSECVDYHCQCKPNYVPVATNLCVLKSTRLIPREFMGEK